MKKPCLVYAEDRTFEAQQLLLVLQRNGVDSILDIQNASTREEQLRFYQEAQAVGIILSQGLKAHPLLNALVEIATDDVINQRKVVFPILFAPKSNLYVYLEQFEGIQLYSNAGNDEQKQYYAIFLQLQKLIRWLT